MVGLRSPSDGEGARSDSESRWRDHHVWSISSPCTNRHTHRADARTSQGSRSGQALRTCAGCSAFTYQAPRQIEGKEVRKGTWSQAQLWIQEVDVRHSHHADQHQRRFASSFLFFQETLPFRTNARNARMTNPSDHYAWYSINGLQNLMYAKSMEIEWWRLQFICWILFIHNIFSLHPKTDQRENNWR